MARCPLHGLTLMLAASGAAYAVPSIVEQAAEGVHVVRDDSGYWDDDMSMSITHQCAAPYQAKKLLDLSGVPEELWSGATEVRLSVCLMVRDYSWKETPPANGLDEAFQLVVNGKVHEYPTSVGAPVYAESGPPTMDWWDVTLPKDDLVRGPNEIIIRKAPSDKNDDYVYLAIDRTEARGNSAVTFDGKTWQQNALTIPGGNGEYMVRLYLLADTMRARLTWQPGREPALDDPAKLILYAGSQYGRADGAGLRLEPGQTARLEWDPRALDPLEPPEARVAASGQADFAWLDQSGEPLAPQRAGEAPFQAEKGVRVSGLQVTATGAAVDLSRISVEATRSYHPHPKPIDMCPAVAPPQGKPKPRRPSCRIEEQAISLSSTGLRCRYETGEHLRLTSLYNEHTACEMVRDPAAVSLFLVEVDGKRHAGSRDFRCVSVTPDGKTGFRAELELPEPALRATFRAKMEEEGLRLGLTITCAGDAPIAFKLAFPHLAGLTPSGSPQGDYYFYPWGGGIIADRPAIIRRGYGDHEAIYQVMDLFSPSRGGGLYLRADDREGWHKALALRKHLPGSPDEDAQRMYLLTAEEYKWSNPLDPVEGLSVAYEYLRLTREPGGSFEPADAILSAHPGDWHTAMRAYADWAHRVWRFRPYPSRLKSVRHMIAAGWGQDILFQDGKYRTDFIQPETDCIELMSWWDWSPLGPWSTPFDRLSTVLTPAQLKDWEPYFVKDPVTGRTMWNNQPGDYDGYNERFGGVPAFRQAIQTYKEMGALVTLYTDPIRCDDATKIGQAHGRDWGVVGFDGEPVKSYEVWNMCHDVAEYRQWVADTMGRVMEETGADGIRLDEYGHRGWACFSKLHQHSFAEPGVTQWQKGIAETSRLVRQAMDEVSPGSVLTTEHPGYDYLMPFLEGCITYDLTVQATPLRPLECNLQRFYFPECKAYELDHQRADVRDRKKFWNAVESFGRYYPAPFYTILNENEGAYWGRDWEPLMPTLMQCVYANRFTKGPKTLYHLYNATGHTVDGPVLSVPLRPDEHLFDLLNCRECEVPHEGDGAQVRMYLARDDVACLAQLPRRLAVTRDGAVLRVAVTKPAGGELVVADSEGQVLVRQPAKAANDLHLSALPDDAKPGCVKLLDEGQLADAAEVPQSTGGKAG